MLYTRLASPVAEVDTHGWPGQLTLTLTLLILATASRVSIRLALCRHFRVNITLHPLKTYLPCCAFSLRQLSYQPTCNIVQSHGLFAIAKLLVFVVSSHVNVQTKGSQTRPAVCIYLGYIVLTCWKVYVDPSFFHESRTVNSGKTVQLKCFLQSSDRQHWTDALRIMSHILYKAVLSMTCQRWPCSMYKQGLHVDNVPIQAYVLLG